MASKILGIGVDIESVSRFKALAFEKNRNFYKRIFSADEIRYCLGKKNYHQHFAARFCAKEAFIKAINRPVKDHRTIEIKSEKNKPFIVWGNKKYLLSLSHDKDKAIAFVVVNQ